MKNTLLQTTSLVVITNWKLYEYFLDKSAATDDQFLDLCLINSSIHNGNCRLTVKSLSRLYTLAGNTKKSNEWSKLPDNIVLDLHIDNVRQLVSVARSLCAESPVWLENPKDLNWHK
jgi:hypothetical protein